MHFAGVLPPCSCLYFTTESTRQFGFQYQQPTDPPADIPVGLFMAPPLLLIEMVLLKYAVNLCAQCKSKLF